jgi:hypothetical protein
MVRSSLIVFPVLLALALVSTAGFAQVQPDEDVNMAVTGEIKKIATGQVVTIEEADGTSHVFKFDGDTTIMSEDSNISFEKLEVGWWIAVDADYKGKVARATYVEVVDSP